MDMAILFDYICTGLAFICGFMSMFTAFVISILSIAD